MGYTKMKLIEKPKQRLETLYSRKETLNKKLKELTTLCNINACMIIYEPTRNKSFVWPEDNPESVRRAIDSYRHDNRSKRCSGVSDFLVEGQRKAEEELHKRNSDQAKHHTWHELYDSMNVDQLRGVSDALKHKAQLVASRIQLVKKQTAAMNMNMIASPPQGYYAPLPLPPSCFHHPRLPIENESEAEVKPPKYLCLD